MFGGAGSAGMPMKKGNKLPTMIGSLGNALMQ